MQGTTHMLGGAAAAGLVAALIPETSSLVTVAASMGIGAIGGLIPDIDHAHSKISKTLWPLGQIMSRVFTHRGVIHSPILYVLLWVFWTMFCPDVKLLLYGTMLFVGIASHLLLDCLNPTGVPLLYPISSKKYHFAKIRTGGAFENVVRVLLVVACVGVEFIGHQPFLS